MMKRFLVLLLLFTPVFALAKSVPQGGPADARIKKVAYDMDDVVQIVGHYGYSTHIQFADDETVESVALGDSLAWEVSPVRNHIFMKPREENATTNMTVLTSKNVYNFALLAYQNKDIENKNLYFQVRFDYPARRAAEQAKQKRLAERKREAEKVKELLADTDNEAVNWNYSGQGKDSVKPDLVWDDGNFTYMQFSANRDMPAVFIKDDTDKKEALVNSHVEGNVIVLHRLSPKFILRKGRAVAAVINNDYDMDGNPNETGTTNTKVHRKIKGAN